MKGFDHIHLLSSLLLLKILLRNLNDLVSAVTADNLALRTNIHATNDFSLLARMPRFLLLIEYTAGSSLPLYFVADLPEAQSEKINRILAG